MKTVAQSFACPAGPIELSALPQPGDLIDGKYRIDGTLGMGGMAIVLAATHLELDEPVAIKMLLPLWSDDPEFVDRFVREGGAAIRIRSEHVVRVYDVGRVFRRPYIVMELLAGRDLAALADEMGHLPIPIAVDYVLQAMEAVAEAHALGIVHRDLKPANLFLTHRADGSPCVKVLDFGLSKHLVPLGDQSGETMPNVVMGSPHYMSPEQLQSAKSADTRADIWSLGAVLHELIAGRPPWQAESLTALCAAILRDPAPPLTRLRAEVPPALEAAVLRCLVKDRTRRFQTVVEMARALEMFGSNAAHASADTIERVIERAGRGGDGRWSTGQAMGHAASVRPTCASIGGNALEMPMRRPLVGFLAAAVALIAIIGSAGRVVEMRGEAAPREAQTTSTAAPQLADGTEQISSPPRPPSPGTPKATASATPLASTLRPSPLPSARPHHRHAPAAVQDSDDHYHPPSSTLTTDSTPRLNPASPPTGGAPSASDLAPASPLFEGRR